MPRQFFLFERPSRFVAGTVGEPGDRTFFLQATDGTRVVSVALEKQQVEVLADRLEQLLDEVVARTGTALPASDWSGAYAGVNFGYGAGSNSINMTFTPASDGGEHPVLAPAGWLGGGQLGYNFQVGGWVFGVEGDIQASGLKQSICFDFCDPSLTLRVTQELPWFATARGRLGYAVGPALFYATGGAAFANDEDIARLDLRAQSERNGNVPGCPDRVGGRRRGRGRRTR